MHVSDFLALPRPAWDFRGHDCCRWVDRYLCVNGYASPIKALGLRYDSERSALRVIAKGGGLVALWSAGMTAVGVRDADQPQAGDVAVIERATADGLNQAMGLFTGDRWASLTPRGLEFGPAVTSRIWRP